MTETKAVIWDSDQPQRIPVDLQEKLNGVKNFQEEFDTTRRECKVWVFTMPIKLMKPMESTTLRCLRHWFVVCDFHNRAFRCELDNPSAALAGGEIHPRWSIFTGFMQGCNDLDDIEGAFIETITTSPRKVYELVCHHQMNFKTYQAVHQNCQNWVMKLLQSMPGNLCDATKAAKFKPLGESHCLLRFSAEKIVKCAMKCNQLQKTSSRKGRTHRRNRSKSEPIIYSYGIL